MSKFRKLRVESLENRNLLAGDDGFLGQGVGDIAVQTAVVVSTGFENLSGDRSDTEDFKVGTPDVGVSITGLSGTRGVKPAYNNGAFALGIGQNVIMQFTVPVDVQFSLREVVEITPDVQGFVILVGQGTCAIIQATSNGANPPQSNDWDRIDSRDYGIGKVTDVVMLTRNGITNIDDLSFTATIGGFNNDDNERDDDDLLSLLQLIGSQTETETPKAESHGALGKMSFLSSTF